MLGLCQALYARTMHSALASLSPVSASSVAKPVNHGDI